MPLQTLLDLSTAHLTPKDRELLGRYQTENRSGKALICYPYDEYGWTVSTTMLDDPSARAAKVDAMRMEGYSEYFVNIMLQAADKGAVMVRFDRDGDFEPGLAWFDDVSDTPQSGEPDAIPSGPRV